MNCVKVENALYCYIKNEDELNEILEKEKPEYDYDPIERHRKDLNEFDGSGFYSIEYKVYNPCYHGFRIKKKEYHEIDNLIKQIQSLLKQSKQYGEKNVSNTFA